MAYSAAALSYLIQGSAKPIVLTGAQKPIGFDTTDSRVNLLDSFICACRGDMHGVMIVFNGRVILGTRARKTHSRALTPFRPSTTAYRRHTRRACAAVHSARIRLGARFL